MVGKVGNPYRGKGGRYKEKRETTLTEAEYEDFYENALAFEERRLQQRASGGHLFDYNVQLVSVSGLLAILYYTGLRVTEIVGDVPHRYLVKQWDENHRWTKEYVEKWTEPLHGIRKMDLSIEGELLKVDVKEVRKHGKREDPVWVPLSKKGADAIVEAWRATEKADDRVFPITKWLAWWLISQVTEGKLYPHFFRMNRATKFAEHEKTSLLDLKRWFGWVDPRTVESYMAKGGRRTKGMAKRL